MQVRYKLPGEATSRLMQQVLSTQRNGSIPAQPPESTRWAIAVAAFGQMLRGDPWMSPDYTWGAVLGRRGRATETRGATGPSSPR